MANSILNELYETIQSEDTLEDLLSGKLDADEEPGEAGAEGEEEETEEELTDLMKYHKSLQKMIDFIDDLTDDGEHNELAFDVEEALRDAMDKLMKLNDEVYKQEKGEEEKEEKPEEPKEPEKAMEYGEE